MIGKKKLLFLVLVCNNLLLWSQAQKAMYYEITEWQLFHYDMLQEYQLLETNKSGEKITTPVTISLEEGYAWIEAEFDTTAIPFTGPYFFVAGRVDYACQVFLNGSYIGFRGTIPDGQKQFSLPGNYASYWVLPTKLLKDGINTITVRIFSQGTSAVILPLSITNTEGALFQDQVVTLLNAQLYVILGVLCAFIGLYFFALWLTRMQDMPNFWYAAASIFIAVYFIEMGFNGAILTYNLQRAFAKACLPMSMAALVQFFISFCRIKIHKIFSIVLFIIPLGIIIIYLVSNRDLFAIANIFNKALIFIQFCIVFITVITIRSIIKGNKEALILLFGVILGLAFGTHDVLYSISGKKPLVWLQGVGFFCLNLSLFVSLTFRSSRLYRELESYSKDVQNKTQQLTKFIESLEKSAQTISAISIEMDADAVLAAQSAQTLFAKADHIQQSAIKQTHAVKDSKKAMELLIGSLVKVTKDVDLEASGLESSAASVSIVADAAADVAIHMEQTNQSAKNFKQAAMQGLEASNELSEAIENIRKTSESIVDIVKAVENFADQTNILSMNAAIEAAHAGLAGKGFAVIANEIKNLASASTEQVGMIRDSILDISRRIEQGVAANANMTESLTLVAKSAEETLERIETISTALKNQRTATEELKKALAELSQAAAEIRKETETQQEGGRTVDKYIDELHEISISLEQDIAGVVKEHERIVQMIQQLAAMSHEGKTAVLSMKELLTDKEK